MIFVLHKSDCKKYVQLNVFPWSSLIKYLININMENLIHCNSSVNLMIMMKKHNFDKLHSYRMYVKAAIKYIVSIQKNQNTMFYSRHRKKEQKEK